MAITWRFAQTQEDMETVYRLRSIGYRRRYRNIPRGRFSDDMDTATLPDGKPSTYSILAFDGDKPVGTARVELVSSHRYPNLESDTTFLFRTPKHLESYLSGASGVWNDEMTIAELGRFTVVDPTRSSEIMQALVAGYVALGRKLHIDVYLAAMNEHLPRRLRQIHIEMNKLSDIVLDRDKPEALLYMVKYFDYFFPRLDMVLPMIDDENFDQSTSMTYYELRSVVDAVFPQDIVGLYWVTPQALAAALAQAERDTLHVITGLKPIPEFEFSQLEDEVTIFNPMGVTGTEIKNYFYDSLARRVLILPDHDTFYGALTSRNYPLISKDEQQVLRKARVGIAGQGTVGGNLAIALARYGFEDLRTSDPDVFDISNLNRQSSDLFTIGENKAESIARQLAAINPFINIEVFEPVDEDGLTDFVRGCDVVVSAMDNPYLIVKLNQEARKQGVPVVLGTDLGAQVLLDIFDYRQPESELLNGRITEDDLALDPMQLVVKIVGVSNISLEMLEAAAMRFSGEIDYFAQTIVSASVCSSMLIRGISALLLDKPIKPLSSIDILESTLPDQELAQRREDRQRAVSKFETQVTRAVQQAAGD